MQRECSSPWGGRFCGYGLYVLKGKPVFTYNLVDLARFRWESAAALTPGKHTIVFDFKYYQVLFRFTGKLGQFTLKLGPEEPMEADHKAKAEAMDTAKH